MVLGLSLICSKICLLFLPVLSKIFTHYSYFIPIAPPIILLFYSVNDNNYHNAGVTIYILHSQLYLLTALIEYLAIPLEYFDLFANW